MINTLKIHGNKDEVNDFINENEYLVEILKKFSGWNFGETYTEAQFEVGDDNILPYIKEVSKKYPSLKFELQYKPAGIYDIEIISVVVSGSNEDFVYCL